MCRCAIALYVQTINCVCGLNLVTEESESVLPSCPVVDDMSPSESEEEEELEVQYWRKERHFRELYLESIEVGF